MHGGTLTAMASSGLLARMRDRGVRTVFYFQVDNPLVKVADPAFLKADVLEIPVQVNGKVRDKIQVPAEAGEAEVIEIAKADANVGRHLAGQSVKRAIYVRGRIVNFVVAAG